LFSDIVAIVVPTFLLASVGYIWIRLGYTYETKFVTRMVTYVGSPALIFAALAASSLTPDAFSQMILASAALHFAMMASGYVVIRLLRLEVRAYLPPFFVANGGNLGLPVCLFAFGAEGLALGVAYFVVQVMLMFTAGIWLLSGQASPKTFLKMPMIYAAILGVLVTVYQIEVPLWIINTTSLAGDLTIPLMLITLGVSLAMLNPAGISRAALLSVIKLSIGISWAFAIVWFLDMSGPARGVLLLQSAMPSAVYTYLFAAHYDREPANVAGIVLISTLFAVAVLPVLVGYVLATTS